MDTQIIIKPVLSHCAWAGMRVEGLQQYWYWQELSADDDTAAAGSQITFGTSAHDF